MLILIQLWILLEISYTGHYVSTVYENLQRYATGSAKMYWVVWACPYLAPFIFILLICTQLPHMIIVTMKGDNNNKKNLEALCLVPCSSNWIRIISICKPLVMAHLCPSLYHQLPWHAALRCRMWPDWACPRSLRISQWQSTPPREHHFMQLPFCSWVSRAVSLPGIWLHSEAVCLSWLSM